MADIAENEDLRMLRIEQIMELFPVSRVTVYRLIKSGDFPQPVKMGRTSLWRYAHLKQWIEERQKPRTSVGRRRSADLV